MYLKFAACINPAFFHLVPLLYLRCRDPVLSPALARRPIITDSIHINKRVHFKQIADVLNLPVEEIRVLNPQYRKDIIPGDVRPYSLVLPSMQVYSYIMSEDSILSRDSKLYARRNVRW